VHNTLVSYLHGDAVLDELLVSFQIKACLHSYLDYMDYEVNSFYSN